jgi:hypothetical protein
MILDIMPIEQISEELSQFQDFLNDMPLGDDPNSIVEYGNKVSSIISRTGKMVADSKWHFKNSSREEVLTIINEYCGKNVAKEVQKLLADTVLKDIQYIVDWADRVNRTATHKLEWCRTVVSKLKEEMKYVSGVNNVRN